MNICELQNNLLIAQKNNDRFSESKLIPKMRKILSPIPGTNKHIKKEENHDLSNS